MHFQGQGDDVLGEDAAQPVADHVGARPPQKSAKVAPAGAPASVNGSAPDLRGTSSASSGTLPEVATSAGVAEASDVISVLAPGLVRNSAPKYDLRHTLCGPPRHRHRRLQGS
ncbi:hypothetical protein GCM10023096_58690 [Nonomuraea ferruginea]